IGAAGTGCALEEIDAVARPGGDVVGPADHAYSDVGYVVVGAAPVGPAGLVRAQRRTQPALASRLRGWNAQIEPQQLRTGKAAIRTVERLAGVFEQDAHQVGPVRCRRAVERKDVDAIYELQRGSNDRVLVERLELHFILRFGPVPRVLRGRIDDQLVD